VVIIPLLILGWYLQRDRIMRIARERTNTIAFPALRGDRTEPPPRPRHDR
jgi:hypothetical protein